MCTELNLKIRDKKHTIKFRERDSKWSKKENAWGKYTPSDNLIEVYGRLGKKKKSITILHELIHAIIHLTRKEYLSTRQEEGIAYALSEHLITVLRTNPELLDQVVEGAVSKSKKVKYRNIKTKKNT